MIGKIYITNYHLEDNQNGKLLIISKNNLSDISLLETAPYPYKIFSINNNIFIYHYQVTSGKSTLITKIDNQNFEKTEIKVPINSHLIQGNKNFYLLKLEKDSIKLEKRNAKAENIKNDIIPISSPIYIANF
ncbi:hypothetical protein [Schinkia azotoformans]|uniref:hypothetical protein n=1 Tax=Schinkia azotoformans TaxID=1454 RepID=UPI002DBB9658|nr:hypothetical protein [Schinkia azotoformans]MEC1714897.1 hypothetical protein [Schinkia azotoformans]MEC1747577.1 hypothetical protein [Schinkia azotoformans]MEC1759341.1 hypothetical protein [Schinkia azotoformans]MED4377107.1 hypothetical protein [Schinkia azotoformans]